MTRPVPPRRAGAAQEGPDPRRQLLGHERLGDVVVGAGLEPGHDVVGVRPRRHMMIGTALLAPQGPAALEAVHAGQHEVDQRQSVGASANRSSPSSPLASVIDRVALVLEGEAHRGPDPLVVLDHQDAPAHSPPAQQIQICVGQTAPPIMPKAGCRPAGVVGLLKFCTGSGPDAAHTARSSTCRAGRRPGAC